MHSTLDGGERSASRPGCFTPRLGALGTHWTEPEYNYFV